MRLANLKSPLLLGLGLALGVALPDTGCLEEDAADDGADQLATADQAVEVGPGEVLAGAAKAVEIVKMFETYQKYGEVEVTTGEILDEVKQVEAQLDELKTAMTQLNDAVTATHKDVLGIGAAQILNSIDSLWQAYRTVSATNDAAKVQAFLDSVRATTASAGALRWSDLDTLSDILAGSSAVASLLDLVAQDAATRGLAASVDDTLGNFAVHARLIQEQGFFLLALADANDPSIDLAQKKAGHRAHIEAQTTALRAATATFNARVAATGATARTAEIGDCTCVDDGRPLICQVDSAASYVPGYTPPFYEFDDAEGGGGGARGIDGCKAARAEYVAQTSQDFQATLAPKLWANAKGFQLWMNERATFTNGIRVFSATYSDQIVPNVVTGHLAFPCDGLTSCSYTIHKAVLGNPNNDAQGFNLQYRCDDLDPGDIWQSFSARTIRIAAEADGQTVTLSCPAVAGDVDKLVGNFADPTPTPDGTTNPWAAAKVTRISSQVVQWKNAAGASWDLTLTADPGKLAVSTNCPYYSAGYTTADVTTDAAGNITRISGPYGASFERIPNKPFDGNLARLVGKYHTPGVDPVVTSATFATITLVDASTVKFTRGDGYSWTLGQTAAQKGTLQVEILDGIPLSLGMHTETIKVDPWGEVEGLLQTDGAYFIRL